MEVSHTNLSEVTWMVLVQVGTVVVLTSSKTTSTGMLAVLADTSLTGGNMSAAMKKVSTMYDYISHEAKASPRRSPSDPRLASLRSPFSGTGTNLLAIAERTPRSTHDCALNLLKCECARNATDARYESIR